MQHRAEPAAGLGNAPTAHIEGQIGREEPVMQLEAVLLGPVAQLLQSHPPVAQIGQLVHQQAIAGRGAQRIHHVDLAFRILGRQLVAGEAGGIVGAGDAAGQRHVQDIQPLLQKRGEIGDVLIHVDLRGTGLRAVRHRLIEGVKGHGFAQIVTIGFAV